MGVYDEVVARCPKCDGPVFFQTKTGPCNMALYQLNSEDTPIEVLAGVNGDTEWCHNCDHPVTIKVICFATVT